MSHPELERCIEVVKSLRHPVTGCPWDLEQTHETLLKYLIEEAYEFVDAVESKNPKLMEEEIGDVLFQVLLHTSMGEETKSFSLESSAKALADKLVRRHPQTKRQAKKFNIRYMDEIESAFKIGKKSTTVNFDWEDYQQVVMKVEEEWQEVKEELPPTGKFNKDRVREEIGDLLFSVAQLARHLEINPEDCLRDANKKFIKRFQKVEDLVKASGRKVEETPQPELEEYWIQVKKL
jgi:uncharacterized protein YabN with tetrapyrrole methylase and pyrophosphatase domain